MSPSKLLCDCRRCPRLWVAHARYMAAAPCRLAGLLVLLAMLVAASSAAGGRGSPAKAAVGAGAVEQGPAGGGEAAVPSRTLLQEAAPLTFPSNLTNFTGQWPPAAAAQQPLELCLYTHV